MGGNDEKVSAVVEASTLDPSAVRADCLDQRTKGPIDRDRLKAELASTTVMSTLLGGFALASQRKNVPTTDDALDTAIYMTAMIAVHACTCAALMSMLLHREANGLHEDEVTEWATKSRAALLLRVPLTKVMIGGLIYLINVLLISWRDLSAPPTGNTFTGNDGAKYAALVIGAMSSASVVITTVFILNDPFEVNLHKKVE